MLFSRPSVSERLTIVEIEVAFRRPLVTVAGTFPTRGSVLVGVEQSGKTGWGEAPAFPSGRFGSADEAFTDLAEPAGWINGYPTVPIAQAALEAARADAAARSARVSLSDWLGASGVPVMARHPIGLLDTVRVEQEVAWIDAHGVAAVKIKIAPGQDLGPVSALRTALPALDIGVDANASYRDPSDPVFDRLAAMGVSFVEQPFSPEDLDSHRVLRERTDLAVCLDESITSTQAAAKVLAAEAADQLSVKLNRHGLVRLREILNLARDHKVGVRIGGTFDTSIGRRHLLAASGLPGVVDAAVGPPAAYLADDVASYPAVVAGVVAPSDTDGLGAEPNAEALAKLELRRTTVEI